MTLLNVLQLRLANWLMASALRRMNRRQPPPREPRSLPPHIA
jgi:hypothetical protein